MANQSLKTIALTELKISKLNMRHGRKKPDISDILPSIRTHGLRQSLLVRREDDGYGVIAGRRRLFALREIAKDLKVDMKVPCIVMAEGDDAEAVEASILENLARLPATEMEQYNAFGRLADEGRTPAEIAEYFSITELNVRRVLALANLLKPIRTLYANDKIDRQTIRALTLATKAQQTEWLRLHNTKGECAPYGQSCKAWVTGGSVITTDNALFDLADYEGEVIADLFGDHSVFANPDAFWAAQSAAISIRIEAYKEAGWADIYVMERGQYFQSWEHEKRARTKGGKVFVEIRHDGAVNFHEGYVTKAEARRLSRTDSGDGETASQARPEMTKAMTDYLSQHRRGAACASLIAHPAIALRLMVAHALVGSDLWAVRSHRFHSNNEGIEASLSISRAAKEIDAERKSVAEILCANGIESVRHNGDDYHLCELLVALLGMSDEEVLRVLTSAMVDSIAAGGAVVEVLAVATETDMSAYWKPDEVFFDLLRDKRAINGMISDIASPDVAKANLTETAKVQKQLLVNRILGEGCPPNPDWRPGWMQVPPERIVEGARSHHAQEWARIAPLLGPSSAKEIDHSEAKAVEKMAA